MTLFPEAFFWYFQKLTAHESVPFNDKESGYKFLEAFLILLHFVENKPEYRDLSKKMVQLLIGQRFLVIRTMIEGALSIICRNSCSLPANVSVSVATI